MRIRWSYVIWWALALLLATGFARLGFWQWGRAEEKRVQLEQVAQVTRNPRSVSLLTPTFEPYEWARGHGHFESSPVILLDNQQRNGKVGVQVYGVFVPDEVPERRMLVDLGWLPMDGQRDLPSVEIPTGSLEISGLRTNPPAMGIRLGDSAQALQRKGDEWLTVYMDMDQLGKALGKPLWPQVLRLDPKLPVGYERDLALHINSLPPERHVGYAVQWWGLAITVLITALILSIRFRRRTSLVD